MVLQYIKENQQEKEVLSIKLPSCFTILVKRAIYDNIAGIPPFSQWFLHPNLALNSVKLCPNPCLHRRGRRSPQNLTLGLKNIIPDASTNVLIFMLLTVLLLWCLGTCSRHNCNPFWKVQGHKHPRSCCLCFETMLVIGTLGPCSFLSKTPSKVYRSKHARAYWPCF